jgi:hypothetical protein
LKNPGAGVRLQEVQLCGTGVLRKTVFFVTAVSFSMMDSGTFGVENRAFPANLAGVATLLANLPRQIELPKPRFRISFRTDIYLK